jgi:signal transduction histidine kinase
LLQRPTGDVPSSLFTQIFALVLATVVVAQLINLALLTALPPDPPRVIALTTLVQAIDARDARLLSFRSVPAVPFAAGAAGPAAARMESELAERLGIARGAVALDMNDVQGVKLVQLYAREGQAPETALQGHFRVGLKQADGWLLVEPRDQRLLATRERQFLLLFLLSALAMLPIAWAFARRLAQPFERFADAAEALGRDPRAAPPAVKGPAEVERAAHAFRLMQQRLQAYVTDRTQMLGAIAHDLRTPLTRLAFRVEALDAGARGGMAGDIAEMEAMVKSTLDLAKADSVAVDRQRLDLGALLEKAADELALTGRRVSAEVLDRLVVEGDALACKRLIVNLLENGESYGGRAHARAFADGPLAVVEVDDEGPGLPPGEEERVFEPFYRLERSRSRDTGGTGLGLSVARSIARMHGGDVVLANRPGRGLRARVTLPLARETREGCDS